jgi:excisionase family DNA binding protein
MRTKAVLTTGDVAKQCYVSLETANNWIHEGKLKAYRTPGGHHRVRSEEFWAFLQRYKMPPFDEQTIPATRRKVLVVDDHAGLVDTITRFFGLTGEYEVASASDGYEAGVMVMKFRPDLVILDLLMPYIDGFTVCRKIKADPDTHHIIVLVITGHPEGRNIEKALEYGADVCLEKPFKMDELKRTVDELFEKRWKSVYDRAM